jgi:hypothetical protein
MPLTQEDVDTICQKLEITNITDGFKHVITIMATYVNREDVDISEPLKIMENFLLHIAARKLEPTELADFKTDIKPIHVNESPKNEGTDQTKKVTKEKSATVSEKKLLGEFFEIDEEDGDGDGDYQAIAVSRSHSLKRQHSRPRSRI